MLESSIDDLNSVNTKLVRTMGGSIDNPSSQTLYSICCMSPLSILSRYVGRPRYDGPYLDPRAQHLSDGEQEFQESLKIPFFPNRAS